MKKILKYVSALILLPFTLIYLVWKQDKWSTGVKIGATIALLIVFAGVGSSGNGGNTGSNTAPTPASTRQEEQKPAYTQEQKQEEFKKLYVAYSKKGGVLLLTKATIIQISNMSGSREELYLALDKISNLLGGAASLDNAITIPDSLKEYKDLSTASMYLQLTATAYRSAVKDFQDYLNKGDLKALKDAKSNADRGDQNLLTSSEAIEKVAKELGVDTSQIKVEE